MKSEGRSLRIYILSPSRVRNPVLRFAHVVSDVTFTAPVTPLWCVSSVQVSESNTWHTDADLEGLKSKTDGLADRLTD
jgi:hypothetical protein